jgi:acyl carrier protein
MQTKEEILKGVTETLHQTFGIEMAKLTPQADLYTDLDIDSIDAIDLLVKLQQMTGKRMQPEAFKSVRSIQDVVDAIHQLLNP